MEEKVQDGDLFMLFGNAVHVDLVATRVPPGSPWNTAGPGVGRAVSRDHTELNGLGVNCRKMQHTPGLAARLLHNLH